MRRTLPVLLVIPLLLVTLLPSDALAQAGRGGGHGAGSGAPPMRPNSPFEDFVDALRLDLKSQVPAVEQFMADGASNTSALATELLQLRQQLLNRELTNKDADKAPVLQAYVAGATRMAAAEAVTFAKVYEVLRQNQHSRAPGAFSQMAGFFFPPVNAGPAGRGASGGALGRLDILTNLFTLTGDQKREIRGLLDETHKAAAPVRKGLVDTRAALGTVIQSGGDQAAIDAAAAAYAVHVTTMTDAEMTVLAAIIERLTPEQRANQRALSTAFALMRGFFVNDRRWDMVPDGRSY